MIIMIIIGWLVCLVVTIVVWLVYYYDYYRLAGLFGCDNRRLAGLLLL